MSRIPPESDEVSERPEELKQGELDCTICLEHYKIGETVTFCINKHIFHSACLYSWLKVASRLGCPLCRSEVGSAVFVDGPEFVEFCKDCIPCVISELEEVVRCSTCRTKFRSLRLVGEEKHDLLKEQKRFHAEGQDFGALRRNAELIHSSIICNQIIDVTAPCGTGKSTVLPVMLKEIVGVERVYVLEPRRHLALENAVSSKQYLRRERQDF